MEVSHLLSLAAVIVAAFALLFVVRLVWTIFMSSIQLLVVAGLAVLAIHFAAPEAKQSDLLQSVKRGAAWAERAVSTAGLYFGVYKAQLLASREAESAPARKR